METSSDEFEDILLSVDRGIARITLNRPGKLNALRDRTADELTRAFEQAVENVDAKVILITGVGRAFCSGYDLTTVDAQSVRHLDNVLRDYVNPLVRAIRDSSKPVVAAINGPCVGAAVGIALAADIVVAARSAYFYEPFVKLALLPDAGNSLFLPKILGRPRASGMMLLGDRLEAEHAERWGMIWKAVDDSELETEVGHVCEKLLSCDASAMTWTKQLIANASDSGLNDQLDMERRLQGLAARSPGVTAAIEKTFSKRANHA